MCRDVAGGGGSCVNGQNGLNGVNATVSVGTTATLPYGSSPIITNTGTASNAVFNFSIPEGATGAAGTNGTNGVDAVEGFTNTTINHVQSTWLAGVATTMTLNNSGYGLVGGFNGPGVPALNDSFKTIEFQIVPGTYTLNVITSRVGNRGFITWYLDSSVTPLGTMDCYLNGTDTIVQSIAGVVIPSSPNNSHTLRAVVTKNVASTGYYIYLGNIWFK